MNFELVPSLYTLFAIEGQSTFRSVASDLVDTTLEFEVGQHHVAYPASFYLSTSARYRGKRYLTPNVVAVDTLDSHELSPKILNASEMGRSREEARALNFPELWETEYRLRLILGQLKLDSRLRYASYIYSTQAYAYSSNHYQGSVTNSRVNTLSYKLEYRPTIGSLVRIDQAFSFEKQRLEFGKISSFISLFGNVPWLSFTASNTINPSQEDWGNVLLESKLVEGAFSATLRHRQDLEAEALRSDPSIFFNETQSALELRYQVSPQLSATAKTAYNYEPLKPVGNNQPRYWESLDFSVRFYENLNSFQISYSHDLNEGQARFYNFQTQFAIDAMRVAINQSFRPNSLLKHNNTWRFTWKDIAGIELSNYPWLSVTQYFDEGIYNYDESFKVFDDVDAFNFTAQFRRSFDSRLERNGVIGNYKNSTLGLELSTKRLYTEDKTYWLKVKSNLEYRLADALQESSYLRRASFGLSLAQTDTLALGTKLSYKGIYVGETVDQHLYQLEQLSLTAKVAENVYAAVAFNKPWQYSSNAVNPVTWSLYPTFYLVLEPNNADFYAFVESETGTLGIGLGFSDLLGFQLQDGRSLVLP